MSACSSVVKGKILCALAFDAWRERRGEGVMGCDGFGRRRHGGKGIGGLCSGERRGI